jgi:hypothetical protein
MAQIVKIKRSNTTAVPTSLNQGEMAYSSDSDKLFIGQPGDAEVTVIGGKLYMNMLDHTAGTLTASSALIADANSKLDQLKVDNLTFNGNTIVTSDTNGDMTLTPNGTGDLILDGVKWPQADGTASYILTTNGSGQAAWSAPASSSFTLSADTGSNDTFNTGETLTFNGGTNIASVVADNAVTFNGLTDAQIRALVSVTDAGGDGSLAYNNGTGVITYTGPSSAEVRAHITAGTGVVYSGGEVSIGQAVATTSNVTFNNVTVDGTLVSDDITTGTLTTSGHLIVTGDMTVNGTTTTVNTSTMTVEDPLMALASGNNAADAVDIGFYGLHDTSGSLDLYSGLFRDANDSGKWKLFKDNQAAPTTTVNTSGTGYAAATLVASLESASATITGGTITGITDLTVADGGTGRSTLTSNGILYGAGTGGINATAAGADGYILVSNSGTPEWTSTVDGGTF